MSTSSMKYTTRWLRLAKAIVVSGFAVTALTSAPTAAQSQLQMGVLSCAGDGGWGLIIGSAKSFQCTFASANGAVSEHYSGVINKFGLDLGLTGQTALSWLVFGPADSIAENYAPGALQGTYSGVGADAAVGLGVGANALVGGGPGSFALQPVSVQVQTGLSVAAGVQSLALSYDGPLN